MQSTESSSSVNTTPIYIEVSYPKANGLSLLTVSTRGNLKSMTVSKRVSVGVSIPAPKFEDSIYFTIYGRTYVLPVPTPNSILTTDGKPLKTPIKKTQSDSNG